MGNADKFLALYKEYEGLVRLDGKDVKELEDAEAGLSGDRLRICRQIRNYLSHVDDPGFLEPSDKMIKFLEGRALGLKERGDVAKKHLKKPEACMVKDTDKVSDALLIFNKLKCFVVPVMCRDGFYGTVSVFDIIGVKGSQRVGDVMKKAKPVFCGPMQPYMVLDPDKLTLCTDDGTKSGKLLGRVWFTGRGMM